MQTPETSADIHSALQSACDLLEGLLLQQAASVPRESDASVAVQQDTLLQVRTSLQYCAQAVAALQESDAQFRAVFESALDSIISVDSLGIIAHCNTTTNRMFGYQSGELIGLPITALMPGGKESFLAAVHGLAPAKPLELTGRRKDGIAFPVEMTVGNWSVGDQQFVTGIVRDITEAKNAQLSLREMAFLQLHESISAAANEATNTDHAIQFAIERICEHTGWPIGHAQFVQRNTQGVRLVPSQLWYLADPERFAEFKRVTGITELHPGQGMPGKVLDCGKPMWVTRITRDPVVPRSSIAVAIGLQSAFAFPMFAGAELVAVLEFFSAKSEQPDERLLQVMAYFGMALGRAFQVKQAEDRLMYTALHDTLTGLPNRELFLQTLKRTLAQSKRQSQHLFAVVFVDLDGFKQINDNMGHLIGDRVLIGVARRLEECLRTEDMVARLGGDEFTALLDSIDSHHALDYLTSVAKRIQTAFQQPMQFDGCDVLCKASIGIAVSVPEYDKPDDILRDADTAMYQAKSAGKGCFQIFSPDNKTVLEAMSNKGPVS